MRLHDADLTIESRDGPHETVVDAIVAALSRRASAPASETPPKQQGDPPRTRREVEVALGSRSYKIIIGEGLKPLELESLQMGCVSISERFFRDGKISATAA